MRTTLTLDDDVAAMVNRLRNQHGKSLKAIVNLALRDALTRMSQPPPPKPFRTRAVDLGPCTLPNLDDISEVLAFAEGETYR